MSTVASGSTDLLTIAKYGAGLFSLSRIVNGGNSETDVYLGWSDRSRPINGSYFDESDIKDFLQGEYSGNATNPTLRFSSNQADARDRYFKLGYFSPIANRKINSPAPINECESFLTWITEQPTDINKRYNIESYGNKNRDLFGKQGVAWVSADKAGKYYEWKGNNSCDPGQAYEGGKSGNQLNIWQDVNKVNIGNGIGINNNSLLVSNQSEATPVSLRATGDAQKIDAPVNDKNIAQKLDFPFVRSTGNTPAISTTFNYTESNTATTSLTSAVTNTTENQQKASVAVKVSSSQSLGKGVAGWAGGVEVTSAWEGTWKETKQLSTTNQTTDATTKGSTINFTFNPSTISTTNPITYPGAKNPFILTEGKYYRAYLSLNQTSISANIAGFVTYSGSVGRLPLNSSLFGSYNDTYRDLSQEPGLQNANLADYINMANGVGNASKLFGLNKVKAIKNGVTYDADQLQVEGTNVITNLAWDNSTNVQTNLSFKIDEISTPNTLADVTSISQATNNLGHSLAINNSIYQDALTFFMQTASDYKSDNRLVSSSDQFNHKLDNALLVTSGVDRIFVKPLNFPDQSESLLPANGIGQQLDLDIDNQRAIGILQNELIINGSSASDSIMVSCGNTANGWDGDDLIIEYNPQNEATAAYKFANDIESQAAPVEGISNYVAYLNGGDGNDTFVTSGGTSVIVGDNSTAGNDNVKAKGRVTFYSGDGFDRMTILDFENIKYFSDFDLSKDSILIDQALFDKTKNSLKFDYDLSLGMLDLYYGTDLVTTVKLANQQKLILDNDGQINKFNIMSYVLKRLDGFVLTEKLAKQLLDDYLNNDISGNQFLLSCLQGDYSPVTSYNASSTFLAQHDSPFDAPKIQGEYRLYNLVEAAPLLKYTVQPFLRAISSNVSKLSDLEEERLAKLFKLYDEVFYFKDDIIRSQDTTKSNYELFNSRIADQIIRDMAAYGFFESSNSSIPLPDDSLEIFTLSDPINGSLFFTTDKSEFDILASGGNFRPSSVTDPNYDHSSGSLLYRLVNSVSSDHLFTTNKKEKDFLLTQPNTPWKIEAIPFFASSSVSESSQSIYRYFNPMLGQHYYLAQENGLKNLPQGTLSEGYAFSL